MGIHMQTMPCAFITDWNRELEAQLQRANYKTIHDWCKIW